MKKNKEYYFNLFNKVMATKEAVYILNTDIQGTPINYTLEWDEKTYSIDENCSKVTVMLNLTDDLFDKLRSNPYINRIDFKNDVYSYIDHPQGQPILPRWAHIEIAIKYISDVPFGTETARLLYSKDE